LGAVPAEPAVPAVPRASVGLDVPIETKLHAPNPRPDWMERSELTGYLARSSVKLVLVDAPAGFGKTTLVAQWRSSALESRSFAWV
jgi:LuxR family maltose regulon positive regulatory protein